MKVCHISNLFLVILGHSNFLGVLVDHPFLIETEKLTLFSPSVWKCQ